MNKVQRVTCRNPEQTERRTRNNTRYHGGCQGCPLVYTHRSDHWTGDIVRCKSPIPIKYGDTVEIIPQQAQIVGEE
jgi:hypothetical protein